MSDFYAAGSFWAAVAGATGTLVVGIATTWYASRLAPKRRLRYRMSDSIPLLAHTDMPDGLEIRREGKKLTDPRLVEVGLYSNGRQAIGSEHYSQGRPLLIELGVPIVEVLKVATEPTEQAAPDYKISGSTLQVGPTAFSRDQRVNFSLLVEGSPQLTLVSNLPDVDVRRQQSGVEPKVRNTIIAGTLATTLLFIAFVIYVNLTVPTPRSKIIAPNPTAAKAVAKLILPSFGWPSKGGQYSCLVKLWDKESGWRYNASSPGGTYGIPAALPGSKMATAGSDWQVDAATQIRWGLGYIKGRYGSPCDAWRYHQKHGYY